MTAALRAGVLGLGMMGRHHVRVLSRLDGVDLVAVADRDGDRFGAATGAGLGVYSHLDEMLQDHRLDLCVVAVPTEDHAPAALRLAHEGIATLIEKPLAHTAAAGAHLADAFAAAGVLGCVGHIERYNPALQSLRDRLDAGDLGEVYQVATRRQGPFPERIRDVGVVKDLATHDIDLTSWVARSPYASVSASAAHRAGRPYEDLIAIVGELENGVVASHLVNWLSPLKERKVVVTGERGCFEADTLSADLTFFANGSVRTEWDAISTFRGVSEGDVVRYAIAKPEPLAVELANFRDAVLGLPSSVVSLADGLATLRVAEAALASAAGAGTVRIGQQAPCG
jgi:UDP-N-acetylglucosamine 3-dehydrogenase